jgi:uncharacterized protein YeaO (DUF488 family)
MIDEWPNETAPSTGKEPLLAALRKEVRRGTVTMLYTARDEKHNQSIALKEFLEVKPL